MVEYGEMLIFSWLKITLYFTLLKIKTFRLRIKVLFILIKYLFFKLFSLIKYNHLMLDFKID